MTLNITTLHHDAIATVTGDITHAVSGDCP